MNPSNVLAPESARELFLGESTAIEGLQSWREIVQPVFYSTRPLSGVSRARRRLGRLSAQAGLNEKLRLPPKESIRVSEALWLSEQVSLRPGEWRLLLDQLPGLQWLFSQRTSYHHIDLDLFAKRGISVSNSGDLVSRWVAEFAFACIVSQAKRIPQHALSRSWFSPALENVGFAGRRVTILGTGRIGAHLASLCGGLGMLTTGLSRDPSRFGTNPAPYHRIGHLERDMEEVLSQSEFLVVTVPSAPETQGLIGQRELSRLPTNATVVSTTHPEVMDQDAILRSLREGKLSAAYLDRVHARRRLWQPRIPNLVVTHNSHAHLPEKKIAAFRKFLLGVDALRGGRDPADRVI